MSLASLKVSLLTCALTLCGVGGCTENASPKTASDTTLTKKSHAECLVCKHENDLACLDVEIDDKTPTVTKDGTTYYFCSDECRKDFQKDPQKYLKAK
jgi:YHS domain-containing protein